MKVFVGMSGGVDSSLAAALLVEQGHDVSGVYMKNWTTDLPGMKCPWAEDLADAKRVAVQLGVDFKVFDFENEYKHKVVDYMVNEYKQGRTPNPDIMCNQEVKFKLFLETALEQGADMIATGHYARIRYSVATRHALAASSTASRCSTDRELSPIELRAADVSNQPECGELLQARDVGKDQTYFLYRASSPALARTLFPLGDYTKSDVRKMAADRGLWTATKKESMGVCFVGNVGMREFLSQYVTTEPGDIIDKKTNRVIGQHDGAIFYTLGQRHGLDVGGGLPYYVVGKDIAANIVYVSQNIQDTQLVRRKISLESLHWINDRPSQNISLHARVRHRGPLIEATLSDSVLQLAHDERAITPGQSVVLYDGDICIGGGIVADFGS